MRPSMKPSANRLTFRRALRDRDFQTAAVLFLGLGLLGALWNYGGAQEAANLIDALAKATPEDRAAALQSLGTAVWMVALGAAIIPPFARFLNKQARPARTGEKQ
ncbi:hypothetical protein [Arthrobacter sp. RCC_34]|uniref:hypothetical protein n=1 Tax=Arthrobacter sp. RCC_34 TaxID=3239230 RepID=UPI0035264258